MLEKIKTILKVKGYFISSNDNDFYVGKKTGDSYVGIIPIHNYCTVFMKGTNLFIDNTQNQLPNEIFFNSPEELILFIEKEFPL